MAYQTQNYTTKYAEELVEGDIVDLYLDDCADPEGTNGYDFTNSKVYSTETFQVEGVTVVRVTFDNDGSEAVVDFPKDHFLVMGE